MQQASWSMHQQDGHCSQARLRLQGGQRQPLQEVRGRTPEVCLPQVKTCYTYTVTHFRKYMCFSKSYLVSLVRYMFKNKS